MCNKHRGFGDPRQRLVAANAFVESWSGINYTFFPILKVSRYETSSVLFDSDENYGIVIHELAHVAHVLTMENALQYQTDVSKQIRESWAIACQWHLTNLEYRSRGITNYGNEGYFVAGLRRPHIYAYQHWNMGLSPDYTSLFINLVDSFNEMGIWFTGVSITGVVNDNVAGYNLATIQANYLKHMYGKSSVTTQLKANKPSGVTDPQIDQLLSFY